METGADQTTAVSVVVRAECGYGRHLSLERAFLVGMTMGIRVSRAEVWTLRSVDVTGTMG